MYFIANFGEVLARLHVVNHHLICFCDYVTKGRKNIFQENNLVIILKIVVELRLT